MTEQKQLEKVLMNWWELKDGQFENRFYFYQAMTKRIERFLKEEEFISDFEYLDAGDDKIFIECMESTYIYHKDYNKWEEHFKRSLCKFIAKSVLWEEKNEWIPFDEYLANFAIENWMFDDEYDEEWEMECIASEIEELNEEVEHLEDALDTAEFLLETKMDECEWLRQEVIDKDYVLWQRMNIIRHLQKALEESHR